MKFSYSIACSLIIVIVIIIMSESYYWLSNWRLGAFPITLFECDLDPFFGVIVIVFSLAKRLFMLFFIRSTRLNNFSLDSTSLFSDLNKQQ